MVCEMDWTTAEQLVLATTTERFGDFARQTKQLSGAVREVSDFYLADPAQRGACPHEAAHQAARLLFFTLADAPKAYAAAAEFTALTGLTPPPVSRILDVGAGYGAQSLGLLNYLAQTLPPRQIQLDAVDYDSAALETFGVLLNKARAAATFRALTLRQWQVDLRQGFRPPQQYDYILIGSTLCELPPAAQYPLLLNLLAALTPTGALIVIEPALKLTSRRLHALRDQLLTERRAAVVAPCTSWTGGCPCLINDADWCHAVRPHLLPLSCRQIATFTGLRQFELKWSYLTLTAEPRRAAEYADAWRVVSDLMKPKGKFEIFLCGSAGRCQATLAKRAKSTANEGFKKLRRGQLVWLADADITPARIQLQPQTRVTIDLSRDL